MCQAICTVEYLRTYVHAYVCTHVQAYVRTYCIWYASGVNVQWTYVLATLCGLFSVKGTEGFLFVASVPNSDVMLVDCTYNSLGSCACLHERLYTYVCTMYCYSSFYTAWHHRTRKGHHLYVGVCSFELGCKHQLMRRVKEWSDLGWLASLSVSALCNMAYQCLSYHCTKWEGFFPWPNYRMCCSTYWPLCGWKQRVVHPSEWFLVVQYARMLQWGSPTSACVQSCRDLRSNSFSNWRKILG